MGNNNCKVSIIGAGLAGCEAALWLAEKGIKIDLYEQKPLKLSPAHKMGTMAELVCSNSLKAEGQGSAGGLLKAEMRRLCSQLLPLADACRVPAGGALAVNRDAFSSMVSAKVEGHPNINVLHQEFANPLQLGGLVLVATGPLTQGALAQNLDAIAGGGRLSFYDAAAPIVSFASLNQQKVFAAARYNHGQSDYLNCALNKQQYEAFYAQLLAAQTAPLQSFEGDISVYEGCMPVEHMAKRGIDTLRFGPMRPVGITNPETGHRPWANVQLRKENTQGSLYNIVGFQTNLKFGEQKRVFALIPGLENAEFVRFGVMHRNTFLNSPKVLGQDQSMLGAANVFVAGQLTGVEGYTESMLSGQLAARAIYARINGTKYKSPPFYTMAGALASYIQAQNKNFQPMGANMGLLAPLQLQVKDKRLRYEEMARRALAALEEWEFAF